MKHKMLESFCKLLINKLVTTILERVVIYYTFNCAGHQCSTSSVF